MLAAEVLAADAPTQPKEWREEFGRTLAERAPVWQCKRLASTMCFSPLGVMQGGCSEKREAWEQWTEFDFKLMQVKYCGPNGSCKNPFTFMWPIEASQWFGRTIVRVRINSGEQDHVWTIRNESGEFTEILLDSGSATVLWGTCYPK